MRHNTLSDKEIKNAKPRNVAYKLGDGEGLFLHVTPQGYKHWRMKYHFDKKERLLTIGPYPEITLAEARERRFIARKQIANGVDPIAAIRELKRQQVAEAENSFQRVALGWHEKKCSSWTPYYGKQVKQRFEKDIFPKLGHKPIHTITTKDMLDMATAIEKRDALEIAHRAVQVCGQICPGSDGSRAAAEHR